MTKILKVNNNNPYFLAAVETGRQWTRNFKHDFPVAKPSLSQQFAQSSETQRTIAKNENVSAMLPPPTSEIQKIDRTFNTFGGVLDDFRRIWFEEKLPAEEVAWNIFNRYSEHARPVSTPGQYKRQIIPKIKELLKDVENTALEGKNSSAYGDTYALLKELFFIFHPNPEMRTKSN